MQVLNKEWESKSLASETKSTDPHDHAILGNFTYGDLQNRQLSFPGTPNRPSKRCLLFMGRLKLDLAREQQVLSPTADLSMLDADRMSEWSGKRGVIAWLQDAAPLASPSERATEPEDNVSDISQSLPSASASR